MALEDQLRDAQIPQSNGPKPGEAFLLIRLSPDGVNVTVSGILANKGLAYMLLELARDAINEWHQMNKSSIVTAKWLPGENQ